MSSTTDACIQASPASRRRQPHALAGKRSFEHARRLSGLGRQRREPSHLKRVFNIAVETCQVCGAAAGVIACLEDLVVVRKMLNHLQEKASLDSGVRIHKPRASPQAGLFS
jgi:hypothetical protein